MLKKIGIVLIAIVLIFLGLSAYIVLNSNQLIARYKPQLEALATEAIGGRVTFATASLQVFPRTQIRMSGFDLREDTGENLALEELIFKADFLGLLSGRLNVKEISLKGPQLILIETDQGIRLAGLSHQKVEKTGRAGGGSESLGKSDIGKDGPKTAFPLDLDLKSFSIREGSITLKNKYGVVQQIIEKIAADASIKLSGSKILLPSLVLAAQVKERGQITINASRVDIDSLTGQLDVSSARFSGLGANFKIQSSYNLKNQSGEFVLEPGNYHRGPIQIAFRALGSLEQRDAQIKQANFELFRGRILLNARARLEDLISFSADLSIEQIHLEQLMKALENPPQVILAVPLSSRVSLSGGLKDKETLKKSLKGEGEFTLGPGEITGLNLGQKILASITGLPFVGGALIEKVPAEFRNALNSQSTVVKGASSNLLIGDGAIWLSALKIETDLLDLEAKGSYIIDGAMDLRASVAFSQDLSAALAARVKELQYALEDNGQLVVPVRLQGTPENLFVTPDTSRLMQGAAGRALEQGAQRLLDKAISGRKKEDGQEKDSMGQNLKDLGRRLGF